jgi:hypothetical protein
MGISAVSGGFATGPPALLTADFNNDGYDDIVAVDETAKSVVVILGGSKGFQNPMSFPVPKAPMSLCMGDFNRDGNLDLLVTGKAAYVLLGTGTGGFRPPVPYPANADRCAVGDFNGDGKLDVAFGSTVGTQVMVALGNGDGTFGNLIYTTLTMEIWAVYPGSFHNNGRDDLILIGRHFSTNGGVSHPVSLLASNGDGTFTMGPEILKDSWDITVADLNRDGNLDFINTTQSPVEAWLGDGNGNFTHVASAPVEGYADFAAIGDVNGDGIPDVVTANSDSSVSILIGNGDGTFQQSYNYTASFTPWVGIGSYFGADHGDIAVVGSNSYQPGLQAWLLRNDGSGRFRELPNVNVPGSYGFALADMNQDGILDLVLAAEGGPENTPPLVIILPGKGKGTFAKPIAEVPVASGVLAPVVADFNGDGIPDFAVPCANAINVGLQQPGGTFQVVSTPAEWIDSLDRRSERRWYGRSDPIVVRESLRDAQHRPRHARQPDTGGLSV